MKITNEGYIELRRDDGSLVSKHAEVKEAYEAASEAGPGVYRVLPPAQRVEIGGAAAKPAPTPPSAPPGPFKARRDKGLIAPSYGQVPARGEARVDPATGATLTRLTDKPGSLIVYSRFSPTNSDGTLLLVHGEDSTSSYVQKVTGEVVRRYDALGENHELRWDYSGAHPSRLYYVKGMQLHCLDVLAGTDTLVRDFASDFPGGSYICNDVEGDSSNDSRYWCFMVMKVVQQGSYPALAVFTYDREADAILGTLRNPPSRPNMVEVSPLGTHALVHWNDGPRVYPLDLSGEGTVVAPDSTHSGWGLNAAGDECFIYQNNRNDHIESFNLRTGATTQLLYHGDLGWGNGMHFAKSYGMRGWVLVSTYAAGNKAWGDNQLLMLPLDGGEPLRLCHTHNLYPGDNGYRNEASAALSMDGRHVYWTGNWGGAMGREVLSVALPADWAA